MKITLLFLLLPLGGFSQKIAWDTFLDSNRFVSTDYSNINEADSLEINAALNYLGKSYTLYLLGRGYDAESIEEAGPTLFILENDSTVRLYKEICSSYINEEEGFYTYIYAYKIQQTDIKSFGLNRLKEIKFCQHNYKISLNNQSSIQKLCILLLNELNIKP